MVDIVSLGLERPTLEDMQGRAEAEINARLPGADSRLKWNNLSVLAWVLAGATHEMFGFLDGIATQAMPDQATGQQLDRHAAWRGVPRKPPSAATGTLFAQGTDGAVIPAGARLVRADAVEFTVEAPGATIIAEAASLTIRATEPGGAGNSLPGQALRFVNSYAGIAPTATVGPDGLGGGADLESDESLRTRLRAREQQGAETGRLQDYVAWAREVPGVTRAWATSPSACLVQLVFVMDGSYPDGIPLPQDEQIVADHIDAKRPPGVLVNVRAPDPLPVDFVIASLKPDDPPVRAAIEAELHDMILRDGALGTPILVSHVREAISIAAGEYDHHPLQPVADIPVGPYQLPIFGSITWQA